MAGGFDRADVEEGVAGAVAELHEAEALLLVEPLYRGITLRARRRRGSARRTAVETATAAVTATEAVPAAVPAAGGELIGPLRLGTTLIEAALLRPPEITTTSH